jgi:hypothetical protein
MNGRMTLHPRCTHLVRALGDYTRAKRANQWMDDHEDPQHPHEDLVDPLCGGLTLGFPEGGMPPRRLRSVSTVGLA